MARFLSKLDYASDEEWFRYLVLNFACCIILGLFNFLEYFDFMDNLKIYRDCLLENYSNETQCLIFFNVNLWATFVNTVAITAVCVVQILMIINNYKFYFVTKNNEITKLKVIEDQDLFVYQT